MKATIQRLLWMMPIVLTTLVVFTDARPAQAQTCFRELRNCFGRAAGRDSWWEMWADGLDCELSLGECARRSIIGR